MEFTITTPDPEVTNWSRGTRPAPETGVATVAAGTQVTTFVPVGTIIGTLAGPTARKAGSTAMTAPCWEQMVTGTWAGTSIGAVCDPTARTKVPLPGAQVTAWAWA